MKKISRRETLAYGAYAGAALLTARAAQAAVTRPVDDDGRFALESSETSTKMITHAHDGKGTIMVRKFGFDNDQRPAGFIIYDIPPGASEGVHVHGIGLQTGAYDEYYYVVSGTGQMEIDGKVVPVRGGDYVHTPLGTGHGIENTHASETLKVHITYINRA